MKDLFTTRYARLITLGVIIGIMFAIFYPTFKDFPIANLLCNVYGCFAGCILAILYVAKPERDIVVIYDNVNRLHYAIIFMTLASYAAFYFEYPILQADTLAFFFSLIFWCACSLNIWIGLLSPESIDQYRGSL